MQCVLSYHELTSNTMAMVLDAEPRSNLPACLIWQILDIDAESGLVRVQAGARVQVNEWNVPAWHSASVMNCVILKLLVRTLHKDVVEALRPAGLTLQNYASIREQQIGGFTQV